MSMSTFNEIRTANAKMSESIGKCDASEIGWFYRATIDAPKF